MEVNVASEKEFILFKLPDAEIQDLDLANFPVKERFCKNFDVTQGKLSVQHVP